MAHIDYYSGDVRTHRSRNRVLNLEKFAHHSVLNIGIVIRGDVGCFIV